MKDQLDQIKSLLSEAIRLIDERSSIPVVHQGADLSEALLSPDGGVWTIAVANSKSSPIKFFKFGHINSPQGSSLWRLEGRELTLKWPDSKAPQGFWVDKLTATADGKRFEGRNQNGVLVKVCFRPTRQPASASKGLDKMEFEELKSLLNSNSWPQATFSFQVTDENSESDKRERAEGIANVILPPMKGKRFLDFGCGEGHLVAFLSDESSVSVGYDLSKVGLLPWDSESDGFLLTSDLEKVSSEGPYDVVLLYDVLDHVEGDMSSVIKTAGSFLADDGVMIIRFHPWCARHGGHLYRNINKAFAHLILTDDEIAALGLELQKFQRIVAPLDLYRDAIYASGLKIQKGPESDIQEVESFFWTNYLVKSRIFRTFGLDLSVDKDVRPPISLCFVDYRLTK